MSFVPDYDILDPSCPSRQALNLLADKWVVLIIVALDKRTPQRNGELKRMLGDISQKMLIQTLRELEAIGVVSREVFHEVPPHVEYSLTDLGRSLLVPIAALRDWAETHVPEMDKARTAMEKREH